MNCTFNLKTNWYFKKQFFRGSAFLLYIVKFKYILENIFKNINKIGMSLKTDIDTHEKINHFYSLN